MGLEVTGVPQRVSGRAHPAPRPGFELPPSKFEPPLSRPGIVSRKDLVDRLAVTRAPVISVVAPPGYGKTILLAEWAERIRPRVAWVSCDDGDNDPVVLLSAIALAVDRVEAVDPAIFPALASSGAPVSAVPRLVSALGGARRPVTVVLDHVEAVTSKQCRDTIAEFAVRLPADWQLALASRTQVPLPTARLRAQGGIFEITATDLAMGPLEAAALLKGAGADVDEAGLHDLLGRTEGWPAGLYIAALALNSGTQRSPARFTFAGDDIFMGDYLRSELLDRVSASEAAFLTRTSVLARMSGPLCDAVLGEPGTGRVLDRMADRNLLIVPLDRRREWYRYHHLLRELLQSELRRREPGLAADLHFRAAAWFEANTMPEVAIEHAHLAGDYDRVARLILQLQQPVWASGRVETVLRWMEWLRDVTSAEHYGAIAVHGSLIFALLGRPAEAERWAASAERASPAGVLPDGSTMESTLAYLRAILCRDGVARMRRDARIAFQGLSPASPYRATMLYTQGVSYLLEGSPDRADPLLARAVEIASDAGPSPLGALVLAEQCAVAAERDRWAEVTALAGRAVTIVTDGRLDDYWTSALVYAWAARAAVHEGGIGQAHSYLSRASRLRPLLSYVLPVVSVQVLLVMAQSYLTLADHGGATAVLAQARDILRQRPDLGTLPAQAGQLEATLATVKADADGLSSLTAAEMRLLPLLSTHLSFREIGERLFVSAHTVRTQVYSAYRKLGVSSRSAAVERAHELGLDA